MKKNPVVWVFLILFLISPVHAQDNFFQEYNPDVQKYDFAKIFITGLSYYNRVAMRLEDEVDVQERGLAQKQGVRMFINDRTLDNTELRIAKNYLDKFSDSPNGLIRKVARMSVKTYDQLVEISVRERGLWNRFHDLKPDAVFTEADEKEVLQQQVFLAQEKKEVAKKLLEASVLLRIVLLSAKDCENEDCHVLAITTQERERLVGRLDSFARENLDWGMQAGQTTVEACVATIREVLEDNLYESRDEF